MLLHAPAYQQRAAAPLLAAGASFTQRNAAGACALGACLLLRAAGGGRGADAARWLGAMLASWDREVVVNIVFIASCSNL